MKRSALLVLTGASTLALAFTTMRAPTDSRAPKGLEKVPAKVTYAEHIAPILNAHCVECHRPGAVAPFSLVGYQNAKDKAATLAAVVSSKKMPPWKAVHGFNEFAGENRLTDVEIATLAKWDSQGAARGNAKAEPKPPVFPTEWELGTPDLVLQPTGAYKLSADGNDVYRNFALKTTSKEPMWVTAMDVRPGNRKIVHHVIAFLDNKGASSKLEAKNGDGQVGYSTFGGPGFLPDGAIGGWAPGVRVRRTPEGTAFRVEPGATIVMQVHYHPSGKPETDTTKMGLYLSKKPVRQELEIAWFLNPLLRIPAGASNFPVKYDHKIASDITMYGAMPHMHLLGQTMKATATKPDGTVVPLVQVEDWDFNWQLVYAFQRPIKLPKGSVIHIEATYDNSPNNPNNPSNPPRPVSFGEQTTDEMFLLVATYTVDGSDASVPRTGMRKFVP